MLEYDVVIVGAATAGTYFANLLAKEKLKVLVIDKDSEENLAKRLDIIHFTRDSYQEFDIDESQDGDEEFVHNFDLCISKSGLNNYPKKSFTKVSVLHLSLFIKRLRKKAIENGVNFLFNEEFKDLIYNNNKIQGIETKSGLTIKSRLVVDASGIPSVVRRKINDPYIENFEIGPKDKFYVLLKYVELIDQSKKIDISTSWPYYKSWIAPQHNRNGAIIGVGANLSIDYARKCMKKFEDNIDLPNYTLQYEEIGTTPYRRPPYSFICDNFIAVGDAACLTKPSNGEGITASMVLMKPASKIIANILNNNILPTKEVLWPINKDYQRNEGANFAYTRALLVHAVKMSAKDNDYLFKHNIIFKGDDEKANPNIIGTLIKGVFKKEFSLKALISIIKGSRIANKIGLHYKNYPLDSKDYYKWEKKANKLWKKAGTMADSIKDA